MHLRVSPSVVYSSMQSASKYSHEDTGGGPPCSVLQLLQSELLVVWVDHSLPGFLQSVDGVDEVQVVFVRLLEQPGGGIMSHVRSFSKICATQTEEEKERSGC